MGGGKVGWGGNSDGTGKTWIEGGGVRERERKETGFLHPPFFSLSPPSASSRGMGWAWEVCVGDGEPSFPFEITPPFRFPTPCDRE